MGHLEDKVSWSTVGLAVAMTVSLALRSVSETCVEFLQWKRKNSASASVGMEFAASYKLKAIFILLVLPDF